MCKGRVIFSSGGNYKVKTNFGVFAAKPLGIFRKDRIKILVGDIVSLKINQGNELNIITKLYSRVNEFARPNIANIDYAIITTSINDPKLNDYYLDKLIAIFQIKNVEPILLFTKADLGVKIEQQEIIDEYINAGFKVIISKKAISELDKKKLNNWLKDKLTVITGQTGVGKSTFLNILSRLELKTNEISKSLGRGKHTTRHSEEFEMLPNVYVIDTPGFSSLKLEKNEIDLLSHNFFNFEKYFNKCKFNNCKHLNESDCEVKKNISERTQKNYIKMINEEKRVD